MLREKLKKMEMSIATARKKYSLALAASGMGPLLSEFEALLREIVDEVEALKEDRAPMEDR